MKVFELISGEDKFCRTNFAVDSNGFYTNPAANPENGLCKAVRWDIQGALLYCYGYALMQEHIKRIWKYVQDIVNPHIEDNKKYRTLIEFNDKAAFSQVSWILKCLNV